MKKEEHNARLRDHYIAIGIRISYFRKLRGLSQEQLAERAGISPGFLSQVEAPGMAVGISLSTLFLIAEALEIPPYKLLQFDDGFGFKRHLHADFHNSEISLYSCQQCIMLSSQHLTP